VPTWRPVITATDLKTAGIAIPLAKLQPRQGRYARMGYAVLIFFVYISLAIAGQKALARGAIPSWFGLWWAHAAVIVLAALILLVPSWRARIRYRRNNARQGAAAAVPA